MCFKTLFQRKPPEPMPVPEPIVPEPQGLKDFDTFEELDAWFNLHDELRMEAPNLCDDYARESRLIAELDGYFLGCHLVYQGQCYATVIFPDPNDPTKPDTSVFHIGNLAIVTSTQECYYADLAWGKMIKLCQFIAGGKF